MNTFHIRQKIVAFNLLADNTDDIDNVEHQKSDHEPKTLNLHT